MVQNLADTPRLAPGDFHELARTLKKLVQNDSNVVVVGDAIQASALLCKGLRTSYRDPARLMTAAVLDKFKDKQVRNCRVLRVLRIHCLLTSGRRWTFWVTTAFWA